MSKRTIALIVVLLIITIALVGVALFPRTQQPANNQQQEQPTTQASPTPVAFTTIALSPNPLVITTTASPSSVIEATINTTSNTVTAVQLELEYDPEIISVVSVENGTFFSNPVELLNSIDNTNGRITYALGVAPGANGVQGTGVVARITVRPVSFVTQQTQIQLLPKTLVTQEGVTNSVLQSATGTTVSIQGNSAPVQTAPVITNPPVSPTQ